MPVDQGDLDNQIPGAEREFEENRLATIKEMEIDEVSIAENGPGSHGYTEAVHVLSIMTSMVDDHLLGHPAIVGDQSAYKMVSWALESLVVAYQSMAIKHHNADKEPEE